MAATGTVRSEQEILELFRDGQPLSSISEQDMRDFIATSKYLNGHGWDFHLDGTYTVGSPRTIAGGVRTQVTIDGLGADLGHPIVGHHVSQFWNSDTNSINPPLINDFGMARFAVTAESTTDPANYFEVELDVATGDFPVIWQETGVFAKGTSVSQSFNFNMMLFAGPDFVTNGGKIYLTPKSDATFWTFGITAHRAYLARP